MKLPGRKISKYHKSSHIICLSTFQDKLCMIEYYEGFLLAVDSLKRTGTFRIDLYAYNCGDDNASLNNILTKMKWKMNIIFGPYNQTQKAHKTLAAFAENMIFVWLFFFREERRCLTIRLFIRLIHSCDRYLWKQRYTDTLYASSPMPI